MLLLWGLGAMLQRVVQEMTPLKLALELQP